MRFFNQNIKNSTKNKNVPLIKKSRDDSDDDNDIIILGQTLSHPRDRFARNSRLQLQQVAEDTAAEIEGKMKLKFQVKHRVIHMIGLLEIVGFNFNKRLRTLQQKLKEEKIMKQFSLKQHLVILEIDCNVMPKQLMKKLQNKQQQKLKIDCKKNYQK